jgi:hypothetical protein
MIESCLLEDGQANGGRTPKENNYMCAEDLEIDIQQVFHVPPNLIDPITHAITRTSSALLLCNKMMIGCMVVFALSYYLVATYSPAHPLLG